MSVRRRRRSPFRRFIAPVATLAILAYFTFHAFNGQYGLHAQIVMAQKEVELRAQLDTLRATREDLERRIALLQDGNLNRDMVDEHARRQLNLARSDEMVIFID
jgi:cell division protein FtsB